jgi:heme oxygenase
MSIRETLRERTAAAHQRLDGLWDIASLHERGPYTQFLQATAAALVPLEARLCETGVEALLTDWAMRSRTASIQADLAGLGAVAPSCPAPALASAEEQFGALYVLEGSRLGGAMIAREVARSQDEAVLANRRYLGHGQGDHFWQSFLEQLDRVPRTESELELVCAGASETFALFEAAALTRSAPSEGSEADA